MLPCPGLEARHRLDYSSRDASSVDSLLSLYHATGTVNDPFKTRISSKPCRWLFSDGERFFLSIVKVLSRSDTDSGLKEQIAVLLVSGRAITGVNNIDYNNRLRDLRVMTSPSGNRG